MDSEAFYRRMQETAAREPAERQRLMTQLHSLVLEEYCAAVGPSPRIRLAAGCPRGAPWDKWSGTSGPGTAI